MARAFPRQDDSGDPSLDEAMELVLDDCGAQLRAANAELLEAKLRLQEVSAQVASAQEEERRRVACVEECLLVVALAISRLRAMAGVESPPARGATIRPVR